MSEVQYTVRDAINRLKTVNALGKTNLSDKGVDLPGEENTTYEVVDGIEDIPTGASLNIEYGNTAPSDTTKLWIKSAEPENVTVDYDIDNGVESIQQLTSAMLPVSAYHIACGTVGTKCYLFGGYSGSYLNTITIFDADTDTVTVSSVTLPEAISGIACGVVGTKCYLFGGHTGSSKSLNTIRVFDTETDTLTTLSVTLPSAAGDIACGVVGTKCYLFGGTYRSSMDTAYRNTIFVFDTETNTISTLPAVLPTNSSTIACGSVGTKIYLFGGRSPWSPYRLDVINVFDTETNTIATASAVLPVGVEDCICGVVGTKCYLFGGYSRNNSVVNTINVFDVDENAVSTLSVTLPAAAQGIACGVVGNICYLFGGGTTYRNTINKFTITFPLPENDIYIQEDTLKNKFTLIPEPTKVVTGVSNVYVGNSNNEAEKCEAYLHDGTDWQEI